MKTELSKVEKIKKVLGMPIDLAEMLLDDGVTVIEAEVFEAGQEVNIKTEDGQSIPLPVGEYGLQDGMVLVVQEEGIIGEIRQATEEQPQEEEEVAAADKPTEQPVAKKVVESVSKETYFSAEEKEELEAKITALEAQVAELSKQDEEETKEEVKEEAVELKEEEVKPITHNPENKEKQESVFKLAANRKADSIQDRVRNTIFKN